MIYDRTHRQALVWQGKKMQLIEVDRLTLPPLTEQEGAGAHPLAQILPHDRHLPARESALPEDQYAKAILEPSYRDAGGGAARHKTAGTGLRAIAR